MTKREKERDSEIENTAEMEYEKNRENMKLPSQKICAAVSFLMMKIKMCRTEMKNMKNKTGYIK